LPRPLKTGSPTSEAAMRNKIKALEELPEILRKHGERVVHCHGVFDLLHIGHIRHFQEAKQLGGVVVVTVTPDRFVNKGPHRPAFTETLRAESVAALDCVDFVSVNKWPNACETIQLIKPDFYVKGSDYKDAEKDVTGGIDLERQAVEENGGKLIFTDDLVFSSSRLINQHLPTFSEEVRSFVERFSLKHGPSVGQDAVESAKKIKVLVVGETIIDEYQYCETIGKAGKEPILAAKYMSTEIFAGGIVAVANNSAALCEELGMITVLGSHDSYEDFIRGKLNSAIKPFFSYQKDAPTILKRRFLEIYPLQKMFEVYVMNDFETDLSLEDRLYAVLEKELPEYDAVVVTDYGHGMLGDTAVELLCNKAKFLAVNTQVNAGNHGYNTISKYPRADYVCISERELRLDARSRERKLRDIIEDVSERMNCKRALITRGENGCVCFDADVGYFEVPAFTNHIVDRIGAGDLVLSVTAPCVAVGVPMDVVGFIANAAGAQAVATVGHRSSLDKAALVKFIQTLLK